MSAAKTSATTTKSDATQASAPSKVRTYRAGADDDAALNVVKQWLSEESKAAKVSTPTATKEPEVSTSDAVRRALRIAAAVIVGGADGATSALVEQLRAERDAARAELVTMQSSSAGRAARGDDDAVVTQLKATEKAYRGFDQQVQRIGNNVNQMTVVAHTGGNVDSDALLHVTRALRAIEEEMVVWERFDNRERQRLMYDRRA